VLIHECYPMGETDAERDVVRRAWEFELGILNRCFDKPVYTITRGDRTIPLRDATGNVVKDAQGRDRATTVAMEEQETNDHALWCRARFSGVLCWGEVRDNLELMKALATLV
jgi:hypothetical protein